MVLQSCDISIFDSEVLNLNAMQVLLILGQAGYQTSPPPKSTVIYLNRFTSPDFDHMGNNRNLAPGQKCLVRTKTQGSLTILRSIVIS